MTAGVVVGYVRVSSADQNTARQELGDDVHRVYTEKVSGRDRNRPALTELLRYVREGDTVRVHSMDRLGRSLTDLIALVQELTGAGVTVEFMKEKLTFRTGDADPYATLQLHLLASFAEFERAIIRQRQAEGIARAKARNACGGRTPSLTPAQVADTRQRRAAGEPVAAIAAHHGVSPRTIYNALRGTGTYA